MLPWFLHPQFYSFYLSHSVWVGRDKTEGRDVTGLMRNFGKYFHRYLFIYITRVLRLIWWNDIVYLQCATNWWFNTVGENEKNITTSTVHLPERVCILMCTSILCLTCSIISLCRWEVTAWTSCSASCGVGIQTRSVFCMRLLSVDQQDILTVSEDECREFKPAILQPCNQLDCPTAWETEPWQQVCVCLPKYVIVCVIKSD